MGTIGSFWRVFRRLFIHCSREKLISPLFFSIFSRNTKYWTFSYRQLKTLDQLTKEFLNHMSDSSSTSNIYSTGKLLFLLPYVEYHFCCKISVRTYNYARTVNFFAVPRIDHITPDESGDVDHIWHCSHIYHHTIPAGIVAD